MPNHLDKHTVVNAPIERVFDLLTDPKRLNEINPDVTVTAYASSEAGGYDIEWEYRFGAMTLTGVSKMITFERPSQLVIDTSGGVPSHWAWTLNSEGGGTHVDLSLDYAVPKQLAFMGKLLEKHNEQSVEAQMANLKRLAEKGSFEF